MIRIRIGVIPRETFFLVSDAFPRHVGRQRPQTTDEQGFVTESSTANLLVFRACEGLISPPPAKILHGISLSVIVELAAQLGIPTVRRDLTRIDQPLLIFRSVHARVVDATSVPKITLGVRSTDLEVISLERSYHVATLDYDDELIFDGSTAMFRRLAKD